MKILVTGCAGFIGSHTCIHLLKNNITVIGIDNLNDYYDVELKKNNVSLCKTYPNFTFYKGHTYLIDNTSYVGSHPLQIRTSAGGSAFTTGVTDNYNSTTGLTQFIVPHEPSDTSLVYQCTVHGSMVGNITIV